MPCSSFRQGVITVILCDLYTLGLSRTVLPQSAAPALVPYSHEVVLRPALFFDCIRGCLDGQRESSAPRGEAGLHPGNEWRNGSVPGERAHQLRRIRGGDGSEESR